MGPSGNMDEGWPQVRAREKEALASPIAGEEATASAKGVGGPGLREQVRATRPTKVSERHGCLANTEPPACHRASWLRSRAFSSLGVGVEKVAVTRLQAGMAEQA